MMSFVKCTNICEMIFIFHLFVDKHLGHIHLRLVPDQHIDEMDLVNGNANIVADVDYDDGGHIMMIVIIIVDT